MKTIEYLPHIADVRMKIQGDSIEQLFEAGMLGLAQLLKEESCTQEKESFTLQESISVTSIDTTVLLIDFLSDVLTISYIHKAVFCHFDVEVLTDTHIQASVHGKKVEEFDEDIKAITYTEAEVEQQEKIWQTLIVFDI